MTCYGQTTLTFKEDNTSIRRSQLAYMYVRAGPQLHLAHRCSPEVNSITKHVYHDAIKVEDACTYIHTSNEIFVFKKLEEMSDFSPGQPLLTSYSP